LAGRLATDVVIVGGGMIGALIAQAFAAADVSVVLLESGRVAGGSTAASSALLLHEPDRGLVELEHRYGPRTSRQLWRSSADAVDQLIALLKRLRVSCDLTRRDAIYYAVKAEAGQRLRREFEARRDAGFDPEWLTRGDLRRITGIAGHAAVRTRRNAQFDPYRACIGVLRAAKIAGARIFEGSPSRASTPDAIVCASGHDEVWSTRSASSSPPATRRRTFDRWPDGFACIGRMFWRPSGCARRSVRSLDCPTS
jgi:glycine/D-amino acid oxidase-like deaminating enzyme